MSPTAFQSEGLTSRGLKRTPCPVLYEPQQFIIASGVYTSQGSSGASALASLDAPSQESQSGRRGVPRLAGPNVGLIDPDYHHPQLLELCELNQKRWESLTIPNQAPLGGFGGAKERSEATRGPPPRRCGVPKGPTQKGNTAQQYYPNFGLWPSTSKNKPSKKLVQYYPQLRGFGVSRFEVQTSMRSREAWTEPKKKDGEMVPQVSPIELSPNREALESHDPSREHGNVEWDPRSHSPSRSTTGNEWEQLPDRTDHEGEVLSPEYRVRIECDCSLGACLCPRRPSNRKA